MSRRTRQGDEGAEIPPPLELLCLNVLWTLEEGAVGEVRESLRPVRPLAYTTVMTVLDRLARKGLVTRRKAGRSFRYTPTAGKDAMRTQAVARLLDQFFDGSVSELEEFLRSTPAPPSGLHPTAAESPGGAAARVEREFPERPPSSLDASLL